MSPKDREEWTEADERRLGGKKMERPMPVQEEGIAVGLEAQDGAEPDLDPEIAEEVELMSETEQAEATLGPLEDAIEKDSAESKDD